MTLPIDDARAVRHGEELDVDALERYVRHRLPGLAGPLEVRQFPGGHSNLTYLVRAGQDELVLRRPPFGNRVKSAHDMGREYRVLVGLHPVYPAAPRPVLYCDEPGVLGAPFYLMERRCGLILREALPAGLTLSRSAARRLSTAFIDNLADLHQLDWRAAGLEGLGRPEGYARRQVEGWSRRYHDARTRDLADVEQVLAWLHDRIPDEAGATLVHNDYKYDNVVLDPADPTRIVAVLDWEMCTIGDPLMDLGTTLAYWGEAGDEERRRLPAGLAPGPTALPGSLTRRQLAARYARRTGRDVSTLLLYYVFGLFKVLVIIQQLHARFVRGATRDARFAHLDVPVAAIARIARRATEIGRY